MKKKFLQSCLNRFIKKLFPIIKIYFILNVCLFAQENKLETIKNLYQAKEYKKIVELLEDEIENSKNLDHQIYLFYAYSLWNLGQKTDAIDALFVSLKHNPSPDKFSQIIKAYSSTYQFKGAMEVCEAGLKKFPNDISLQLQKGYLLARFRKTEKALKIAEFLKSQFPENPRPLVLEAHIYSIRKEWDKAEISLEWANSLDSNNPVYKNNLAIVYEKIAETQSSKEKKLEYLQKAKSKLTEAIQISSTMVFEQNLKRINEKLSQI